MISIALLKRPDHCCHVTDAGSIEAHPAVTEATEIPSVKKGASLMFLIKSHSQYSLQVYFLCQKGKWDTEQ